VIADTSHNLKFTFQLSRPWQTTNLKKKHIWGQKCWICVQWIVDQRWGTAPRRKTIKHRFCNHEFHQQKRTQNHRSHDITLFYLEKSQSSGLNNRYHPATSNT
jgi:hypothetical protein